MTGDLELPGAVHDDRIAMKRCCGAQDKIACAADQPCWRKETEISLRRRVGVGLGLAIARSGARARRGCGAG